MPTSRPNGSVFVSYAHAARARVEPLVEQLKARFNVFWDRGIQPGDNWFDRLADELRRARCVVVLWTAGLDSSRYVTAEIMVARTRGVLIPVMLDVGARVPDEFLQWQYIDLTGWPGRGARELHPLFARIKVYLERPPRKPWSSALAESEWIVPQSVQATGDLQRLAREVATLGGVLRGSDGPVADLRSTLKQIHDTCAVVGEAIDEFLEPARAAVRQRLNAYRAIEKGRLTRLIDDKRGHCSRILEHYGRVDGVRDWLLPRTSPDVLKAADEAFGRLATADGDLFASLSHVGEALTDEATDLVNLLVGGQDKVARERIASGRQRLLPLRRELAAALSELQRIEASLGYVQGEARRRSRTAAAGRGAPTRRR